MVDGKIGFTRDNDDISPRNHIVSRSVASIWIDRACIFCIQCRMKHQYESSASLNHKRRSLLTGPLLSSHYDPRQALVVAADASVSAVGGILLQGYSHRSEKRVVELATEYVQTSDLDKTKASSWRAGRQTRRRYAYSGEEALIPEQLSAVRSRTVAPPISLPIPINNFRT